MKEDKKDYQLGCFEALFQLMQTYGVRSVQIDGIRLEMQGPGDPSVVINKAVHPGLAYEVRAEVEAVIDRLKKKLPPKVFAQVLTALCEKTDAK